MTTGSTRTEVITGQADNPLPPLVVHVIYALGTGGLENGLVNIINRCPPARYRHAIVCLTVAERFAERLTAPGVEVIELHKKPGYDFGMYRKLWQTLRRLKPAIVHSRNLAALETQVLGVLFPSCIRIHGEHGRDVNDLDGSNRKYQLFRRLLNPLVHRFIAVSQDLAYWLTATVGISEQKVIQIYNGVDSTRFVPSFAESGGNEQQISDHSLPRCSVDVPPGFLPQEGGVVVGTVGRLATVKNQALLLEAIRRIVQDHPQLRMRLRCILVGDGPERSSLNQAVDTMGLQSCVYLAGDREDMPAWLRSMDIFVLPSLGEGISNTVLEAMATGLPVIATNVGGNPELVEPEVTGLLVPSEDVEALVESILRLINDPQLRLAMGEAAIRKVRETFDWDRTVAAYLGVYDELLYGTRSSPLGDNI